MTQQQDTQPSEKIQVLGRALWGEASVRLGPVPGTAPHNQYVGIPSLNKARFLVPKTMSATATARLLREYNALREPFPRIARAAFARVAGVGLRLQSEQQVISVGEQGDELRQFAAESLQVDPDTISLACSVRVESGLARPTVTVVDNAGQPVLYLKIAVSELHRRRLHIEREGMVWNEANPVPGLVVPRAVAGRDFGDREVLAVTPLPRDVRRLSAKESAAAAPLQRRLAERVQAPSSVADSEWLRRIEQRSTLLDEVWRPRVARAIETIREKYADDELLFGPMHGDWTPWNTANTGENGLALWDWEFFTPSAPFGLEQLSTGSLVRTTLQGETDQQFVDSMRAEARLDPARSRLADLFCLDMGIRRAEEAAAGYQRQVEPAAVHLDAVGG